MSQQIANQFIQTVYTDESLRNQVVALGQDTDGLLKLAASRGFEFSSDDFQSAVREAGYGTDELSEAQLSNVTGGAGGVWTGSTCSDPMVACVSGGPLLG